MTESIVIVGAFHEIFELAEECFTQIIGIIDFESTINHFPYPYLGSDDEADQHLELLQNTQIILSPDSPATRDQLFMRYSKLGCKFGSLISPRAMVSKSSQLGEGVVLQRGVNISSKTVVERCVKFNIAATVMHDSHIGMFTTIAPNAVVLGNVKIGSGCYVGANSTILPNITIGKNSIIGAGAVVTKNMPDNVVVAGNPARILRVVESSL